MTMRHLSFVSWIKFFAKEKNRYSKTSRQPTKLNVISILIYHFIKTLISTKMQFLQRNRKKILKKKDGTKGSIKYWKSAPFYQAHIIQPKKKIVNSFAIPLCRFFSSSSLLVLLLAPPWKGLEKFKDFYLLLLTYGVASGIRNKVEKTSQ